jgi:hypothetical protein
VSTPAIQTRGLTKRYRWLPQHAQARCPHWSPGGPGRRTPSFLDIFSAGFDYQGVVPGAYAVFAVELGIAAGAVLHRTLPTLAVTLAGYVGVRSLIAENAREHYMTPVTRHFGLLGNFQPPGPDWLLDRGILGPHGVVTQNLYGAAVNGTPIAIPARCQDFIDLSGPISKASLRAAGACARDDGYRSYMTYQPAGRFWIFQGIEASIFVALAAALIAVAFWVIRRRDA